MIQPIWRRPALLLAIGAALLSGCTASPTAVPNTSPALSPRPAELDVLPIAPCTMLDRDQQARFAIFDTRTSRNMVNGLPSDGCVWRARGGWGYNAQTVPIPANVALTDPTAVSTSVAGYGAVQTWFAKAGSFAPPICLETIDTTQGAAIRVQASPGPGERADPDAERPAVCARAQELAEAVMTTIRR